MNLPSSRGVSVVVASPRHDRQGFRTDRRDGWVALAAARRAGFRAALVIPTNLELRADGTAVMGAGLARAAATRFPGLDVRYGRSLREGVGVVVSDDLILVPTKHRWQRPASLDLIAASADRLVELVRSAGIAFVLMPRIGSGLGCLDWRGAVRPMLRRRLAPIASRVIFLERGSP